MAFKRTTILCRIDTLFAIEKPAFGTSQRDQLVPVSAAKVVVATCRFHVRVIPVGGPLTVGRIGWTLIDIRFDATRPVE